MQEEIRIPSDLVHEFIVVTSLQDTNAEGETIVVKETASYKVILALNCIEKVSQVFTTKGNVSVALSSIKTKDNTDYIIKGNYNDVKNIVYPIRHSIGFKKYE